MRKRFPCDHHSVYYCRVATVCQFKNRKLICGYTLFVRVANIFITEFHSLDYNIFETIRSVHKMFNVRKSAKNVKIVLFALFENQSSDCELWRRSETVIDSNVETVQKVIQHHFCVLDWPPYLSYFALYDFFLRERVCVCRVPESRGILPKYLNNFIVEKILFVLCQSNSCCTVDTGFCKLMCI